MIVVTADPASHKLSFTATADPGTDPRAIQAAVTEALHRHIRTAIAEGMCPRAHPLDPDGSCHQCRPCARWTASDAPPGYCWDRLHIPVTEPPYHDEWISTAPLGHS